MSLNLDSLAQYYLDDTTDEIGRIHTHQRLLRIDSHDDFVPWMANRRKHIRRRAKGKGSGYPSTVEIQFCDSTHVVVDTGHIENRVFG